MDPQVFSRKYETAEGAEEKAKEYSLQEKETAFYVIHSGGAYFVDDTGFVRNFEKGICIYEDGKRYRWH